MKRLTAANRRRAGSASGRGDVQVTKWRVALLGPRPTTIHQPRRVYSHQEQREVVQLIEEGWPPLDVATAYSIPVWTSPRRGWGSAIYELYGKWAARWSKSPQEAVDE